MSYKFPLAKIYIYINKNIDSNIWYIKIIELDYYYIDLIIKDFTNKE